MHERDLTKVDFFSSFLIFKKKQKNRNNKIYGTKRRFSFFEKNIIILFRCDEMCGYVVKALCFMEVKKTSQPISYSADNDMKTRCFVMFSAGIKSKSYPRNRWLLVCSKSVVEYVYMQSAQNKQKFYKHIYISRAQKYIFRFYIEKKIFYILFLTNTHLRPEKNQQQRKQKKSTDVKIVFYF